jgi:hypothetical protein
MKACGAKQIQPINNILYAPIMMFIRRQNRFLYTETIWHQETPSFSALSQKVEGRRAKSVPRV